MAFGSIPLKDVGCYMEALLYLYRYMYYEI